MAKDAAMELIVAEEREMTAPVPTPTLSADEALRRVLLWQQTVLRDPELFRQPAERR
jgi:hypothetical protein